MKYSTVMLGLCCICLGAITPQVRAQQMNVVEEGSAKFTPWSGYWWPHREGAMLGPLTKYDQLTGKKAADWEMKNHPAGESVPKWHGYCHAWAAASVLEKEPRARRQMKPFSGNSQQPVLLGIGDQKGLLSACHAQDVANTYGDRFGDDRGSEDTQDLAPEVLWRLLKLYVKQQGLPLILDIEAGPEVWNYPIYAYRVEYSAANAEGTRTAVLNVLMADNGVVADSVGVKIRRHSYSFSFKMRNNAIVMGSGKWTGNSRKDHPDFAWYPYVAVPENPEVDYKLVKKMVTAKPIETTPEPATQPENPVRNTEPVVHVEPARNPETPPVTPTLPEAGSDLRPAIGGVLLSPLELVSLVTSQTSSFGLDITVDRFDGARYQIGETFQIRGTSEKPGYLYLLQIDSQGTLSLLYPQPGQDNRIQMNAKKSFTVPGPNDPFAFPAKGPVGTHRVKAIVTQKPLLLTGLNPNAQQQFRQEKPKQQPVQKQQKIDGQQTFRWNPAQEQVIQTLLRNYQDSKLKKGDLGHNDAVKILGEFTHDEVSFRIEAAQKVQPQIGKSNTLQN